jgi:hypothetical protein
MRVPSSLVAHQIPLLRRIAIKSTGIFILSFGMAAGHIFVTRSFRRDIEGSIFPAGKRGVESGNDALALGVFEAWDLQNGKMAK